MQPRDLGGAGNKELIDFFISCSIRIHLHDSLFDYGGIKRGGVFFKFLVVVFVAKL